MSLRKTYYSKQSFGPVTGFNSGVGIMGPPPMTAWCFHVGDVLIDCGIRHLRKKLLADLEKRPVSTVLLTHYHEDHSGNAAAIKNRFDPRMYGHPQTREKLKQPFKIRTYQHAFWGKSDPVEVEVFPPLIECGAYSFKPVHTPGHSRDHTVYLEENQGWLFSGDLYLGTKIKFFRSDEILEDQLRSLKTILKYEFEDVFCGHRPTMKKGKLVLQRKLDFLENFYGSVKRLVEKGMDTPVIIRQLDPKNDRSVKWLTLNNACFSHMVRSAATLASKENTFHNTEAVL